MSLFFDLTNQPLFAVFFLSLLFFLFLFCSRNSLDEFYVSRFFPPKRKWAQTLSKMFRKSYNGTTIECEGKNGRKRDE